MEKLKYEILRETIPSVKLYSSTSKFWYDNQENLVPWISGSNNFGPNTGYTVYNTGGNLNEGYYKWNGNAWVNINKSDAYDSFKLPIYLNSSVDEMGVMSGFDGDIEQVEQLVNFTYTIQNRIITIYSTTNTEKLRKIVEHAYTIEWGDTTSDILPINNVDNGSQLPFIKHAYGGDGQYTISISLKTPWSYQKLSKTITIPFNTVVQNPFGVYTGLTIPTNIGYLTYINNLDNTNNITGPTNFTYIAIGKSRISEKKLYGENKYTDVILGTDNAGNYSAYTIDNLSYKDYSDGYTVITGNTSAYSKEEVFNNAITRNEHFLGFIEEPDIYSDIFVERGKQSVLENNFRLCEIDNVGEFDIYENGLFNVRKQ